WTRKKDTACREQSRAQAMHHTSVVWLIQGSYKSSSLRWTIPTAQTENVCMHWPTSKLVVHLADISLTTLSAWNRHRSQHKKQHTKLLARSVDNPPEEAPRVKSTARPLQDTVITQQE